MELSWLAALVAVADSGSQQAAARSLRVSRGTLRTRLHELEATVGVALLARGQGGVRLTRTGVEFLVEARALLRAAQDLEHFTARREGAAEKPLRVMLPAGIPTTAEAVLASVIRSHAPALRLELRHHPDPAADPFEDTDLVVHFGALPTRRRCRTFTVLHMPMALRASTAYLERRGRPQSVDDLAAHELIHWVAPGHPVNRWDLLAGGHVEVAPWFSSDHIDPVQRLALADAGIAWLPTPDQAAAFEPKLATLEAVLPSLVGGGLALRLLVPEANAQRPAVRAVLALLRDTIGSDRPPLAG